jgi:hypothetical protein
VIYIGRVKMTPPSTPENPWLFARLGDARNFAFLADRVIWAAVHSEPASVYRVFPGGRIERYPAATAEKPAR